MTPAALDGIPVRPAAWFRRPQVVDRIMLVVSLVAAATEATLIQLGVSEGGYVALAISAVGIAVSRRYLWLGLVVTALAPAVDTATGMQPLVLWTIAIFTAVSVTVRGLPAVATGVIVAIPAYVAIVYADGIGYVNPTAFTAVAMAFAAAAFGSAVRNRYSYWLQLEQRAADELANRESETARRVSEERLRIARDLHDVVGHEVAVMGIHLGVLEVNLPDDAATARDALAVVRTDVQAVLQETQRILQILRTDETVDGSDDPVRPAPAFAGIVRLVEMQQQAGGTIDVDLCPTPENLDAEVGTAAFRVVQEVLTNFQRHGVGTLSLRTSVAGGLLTIRASNEARKRPGQMGEVRRGLGLIGMRERVTSAGGRLTVEDGRTFTVTAVLRVEGGTV